MPLRNLGPIPYPPPSLRKQLGVPEDVSDATLADLLGMKQPRAKMEEVFGPLEVMREAAPTAVRTAAGLGGGILAAGGGIPGIIGAGALNVFGVQLASQLKALNR